MKKLPIGISDYKKLIENDYYYVDKTLFIKELWEEAGEIKLITRPRRFGKTLNLSTLRYFFERVDVDNSHLFSHTAIWHDLSFRELQGQFPVIFLTFKDVKEKSWESCYKKIREVIANEFERHFHILEQTIAPHNLKKYLNLLNEEAEEETYGTSLLFLTRLLHDHYKKRVIVLIDEYDAPIHEAYVNGYYPDVIRFFRSLMASVFKDNSYLERGLMTGILRAAREGIFSGLNNLQAYGITHTKFQDKFGFTQNEVKQLLNDQNILDKLPEIQAWYNGYSFGEATIYNPWSLNMYVHERGLLCSYWANTSDNQLIKKLLIYTVEDVKKDLESLLNGQIIEKEIDEAVIFPGIEHNPTAVWSLLLFTGYLTYTKQQTNADGKKICLLTIPNKEIMVLYKSLIKAIIENTISESNAKMLLTALTTGDTKIFSELLQEFISNSMSVFDLPKNEQEKSYHLFILGLLVYLMDTYEIKSNRESGFGRYDIMLIPKDSNKLGIIMEFKKAKDDETIEQAAYKALEQIKQKNYAQELKSRNVHHIKLMGIAFLGKKVLVVSI